MELGRIKLSLIASICIYGAVTKNLENLLIVENSLYTYGCVWGRGSMT